jgi:glucose/arabinose dehydrogenase
MPNTNRSPSCTVPASSPTASTRFSPPARTSFGANETADNSDTTGEATAGATSAPAVATSPGRRRRALLWSAAVLAGAAVALALFGRGSGLKTRAIQLVNPHYHYAHTPLRVVSSTPADADNGVAVDTDITLVVKTIGGRINASSINPDRVSLVRTPDQVIVPTTVTVAGDRGDRLVIHPAGPLDLHTDYTVFVTDGVVDQSGNPILPHQMSFVTAGHVDPALRFDKVAQPTATGAGFTSLVFGPDHRLYAGADDGRIFRFPVSEDGTLGAPQIITALADANHGKRLITGFCFDPSSTADRPIVYVSNAFYGFHNCPDFTSKMTRMSGSDLATVEDVVINLPRSAKDHMINQPSFGPDGALYWPQPSNSAFGAPDPEWSNRPEHLLNASILRLDLSKLKAGETLDAKTKDAGGAYDPFAPDAPLTIYAYGVRLAFDLCWHSNGHLYAAVNGSSPGGNTPAGPGVPAVKEAAFVEDDWLFRITPGKYYGHPNPAAGHFVFNGGNPTAGHDFADLFQYPVGTRPDSNWERPAYVFGRHRSADGTIEYTNVTAFGGKLRGKLMICRYNWGSDVLVLGLDVDGNVISSEFGIPGLSDFEAPLDLIEDRRNGNVYVAEYGAQRITLARPASPATKTTADAK